MPTFHLVEVNSQNEIIDEVELTDDVLENLGAQLDEDESAELSLSDEATDVVLVELDDNGEVASVESLTDEESEESEDASDDDSEDESDEDDSEDESDEEATGLSLSVAGMLGKLGTRISRRAAVGVGRAKGLLKKQSFGKHPKAGAWPGEKVKASIRTPMGRAALGKAVKPKLAAVGSHLSRNKSSYAAAGAGVVGGMALKKGRGQRRSMGLSLSADEQRSTKNPLIADAEIRTPKK